MTGRLLLRLALGLLIVANLGAAAAWLFRERLVELGWLDAPPPARVDLPPIMLPESLPDSDVVLNSPAVASARAEQPGESDVAGRRLVGDASERVELSSNAVDGAPPDATGDIVLEAESALGEPVLVMRGVPDASSVQGTPVRPELLPSREPAAPGAIALPESQSATAPNGNSVAVPCIEFGPIENEVGAERIRRQIVTTGAVAELVGRQSAGPPRYLVYVPPAPTRQEARSVWRALVAEGIEAYVIPDGERENAVSVGLFSQKPLALAQRDRVRTLGHAALVHTRQRIRAEYFVRAWAAPAHVVAGLARKPCSNTVPPPQ